MRQSKWASPGSEDKQPTRGKDGNLKSYLGRAGFQLNLGSSTLPSTSSASNAPQPSKPGANPFENSAEVVRARGQGAHHRSGSDRDIAFKGVAEQEESSQEKIHAVAVKAGSPSANISASIDTAPTALGDKSNALPVSALAFTLRSSSRDSGTPSPPPQELSLAQNVEGAFSRSDLFSRPSSDSPAGSISPPGKRMASRSFTPSSQANKRFAAPHDSKVHLAQEHRKTELERIEVERIEAQRKRALKEQAALEKAVREAEEREALRKQTEKKHAEEREASRKAVPGELKNGRAKDREILMTDFTKLLLKLDKHQATKKKLQNAMGDIDQMKETLHKAEADRTEARGKRYRIEDQLTNAQKVVEEAKKHVEDTKNELDKTQEALRAAMKRENESKANLKTLNDTLHGLAVAAIDELEAAEDAAAAEAEALKAETLSAELLKKETSPVGSPALKFNSELPKLRVIRPSSTIPAHEAMEDMNCEEVETEGLFVFKALPKQGTIEFPSETRSVRLSGFPSTYATSNVLSLVWGGRIEKIMYITGQRSAIVKFMTHDDCMKYFKSTSNGIPIPNTTGRYAKVELGDHNDHIHDFLRGCILSGVTRCVRAIGVAKNLSVGYLTRLADRNDRMVERIINGTNPRGNRVVEFRFNNIKDATKFKLELSQFEEWETVNIFYGDDPCAKHNGVHTSVH
ncbi:hypothetical protein NA57DRAFT_73977 [Rhizodiscina lignyota]|uniref:Uncharacterized protein n=1 Tax=Rhizodiscina lignyota TaxID=1504668 RepID=A0A9P4ILK4_9PEZI|nr:hypothetical protein NA57DRAFT_73977 [Rhizodiscina lignyota]